MKQGYFGGVEISLSSRMDGYPIILIKNDGEGYKAPVGENCSGYGKIFCQSVQQIEDVRNAFSFLVQELDIILKD